MKVLLITSKPPYPTTDGGCYATARLIDCFVKADIEFSLFTLCTDKHPFDSTKFPKKIIDTIEVNHDYINTRISLLGAIRSLFSSDSYNVNRFYNQVIDDRLKAILKDNYTHVVFDSLYSTPYLTTVNDFSGIKTFIRTHNVEHEIWEQNSLTDSNGLRRAFSKNLSHKLKAYELAALNSCDGILSISEDDTKNFRRLDIETEIYDIPVSIEVSKLKPSFISKKAFHLGSMNWRPNVEAVEKLIDIWPEVQARVNQAELHIAGSGMENWKHPNVEGIIVDGFVQDVDVYAQRNGILVSPINSGSGVKIKILEMLALGVPIITTGKGAEGLKETNMLVVANKKSDLIASISDLLNSEELKRKLSDAGQQYINKYHNIDRISQNIKEALSD